VKRTGNEIRFTCPTRTISVDRKWPCGTRADNRAKAVIQQQVTSLISGFLKQVPDAKAEGE